VSVQFATVWLTLGLAHLFLGLGRCRRQQQLGSDEQGNRSNDN